MSVRFATPQPETRPVQAQTRFLHPPLAKTGYGDDDGPEAVSYFTGHYRWRFLGKHDDDYSPDNPSFSRVKPGSVPMPTEAMIENMLNIGRDLSNGLLKKIEEREGSDEEQRVYIGEQEHFQKLSCQLGYYPAYWLQPEPLKPLELPAWFKKRLRAVLSLYLREGDPRILSVPEPVPVIPTSASWPTYQPGIACKVIGSSFYYPGERFAAMRLRAQDWAAKHNLDPVATFANAYGTRTGPLAKFTRDWRTLGDAFYSDTESISTHTRRRQIYMAPMPAFLALRRFTRICKATRKTVLRGGWHAGASDDFLVNLAAQMRGEWWEFDVSGYDTTIQRAIHLEIAAAAADVHGRDSVFAREAADYAMIDDIGTIYPRNDGSGTTNRRAVYVTRSGFLSSGILPTAEIGNIIHQPIIDEFLYRAGYKDPIKARQTGDVVMLLQGDDLLLHAENIDAESVAQVYSEVGLKAKIVRSNRFLMKFRFPGHQYPVAGRILQQTAFNEHEPLGRHALALGVIGLAARWAEGPHPTMIPDLRAAISETGFGKLGIVDGPSAKKWLASPPGADAAKRALESAAGEAWFQRHLRDAEYKPSSAAIVQFAAEMGFSEQDSAESLLGRIAISKICSSNDQTRLAVREALWKAYNDGLSLEGLDLLALKLLNVKQVGNARNDSDESSDDGEDGDD